MLLGMFRRGLVHGNLFRSILDLVFVKVLVGRIFAFQC